MTAVEFDAAAAVEAVAAQHWYFDIASRLGEDF
jgi:hypothetical protein